jgi:ABC-type multidrug transport system permease subunit
VATPISFHQQQHPERRQEPEATPRQRGFANQVFTMARRYRQVMWADRAFLLTTLLMPILLGVLVRAMPAPLGLTGSATRLNTNALQELMILVMSAVLSGTALSIREFIKERDIFERERMAGLSAGAYLFSKVLVLGVISVLQVAIIVVVGLVGQKVPSSGVLIPGSALIEIFIAMAVLCVASMLLGLAVSTLVTKSDQTMPILVGITMVQVALSGGMFPLTGAMKYVSMIAPARWGMGALGSTVNLNVINPPNPLQPAPPDTLWTHSATQWIINIVVLCAIGVIWTLIARARLATIGPKRRKAVKDPRQESMQLTPVG